MIDEFLDFLIQTVTIEPYLGQDAYGKATYGDPVEIQARVVGKHRLVRTVTGDEKVSTVTVYLGEVRGVTVRDRITLPAPFVPSQPLILAVETTPDELGIHHERVLT
jgi:hypothetical protein